MAKVKLTDLMKERQLLSFELFPPKTDKGMENLPGTIEKLCEFKPEYISCTYGAGGGNVVTDAFGIVALVALAPLIAIQIMGLIYAHKAKSVPQPSQQLSDDTVVELEEE